MPSSSGLDCRLLVFEGGIAPGCTGFCLDLLFFVPSMFQLILASIGSTTVLIGTPSSEEEFVLAIVYGKNGIILFTSESVNEGHPDKLCDQISDAILDACLEQDPESKVACETCTKTNMVMVFGEITTKANVDYEKIVRKTCREIGFVSADVGLDADNCKVLVNIEQQSPDIAQGVHGHLTKKPEEVGAGDQGHMFGYATDETPELMPLSHVLATKLGAKLTEVRKNGTCAWLRPDGKTQVTVEYLNEGGAMVPVRVHTVLISTQHDETVTNDEIAADLKEHVITPVIPEKYLDDNTIFHLNPSGRFVIGGPHGDAGLTGRKIIIDTYGGWGAHGDFFADHQHACDVISLVSADRVSGRLFSPPAWPQKKETLNCTSCTWTRWSS
ncbi:hypothetical protein Bca52824_086164 [Brassica carinata]|uniref:S-adenosylmethionine synthase n=1 Tax=Brassica carinata TaxID=52824 RepID=A0A8X7P7B1_BRACI|nr:hypothetical protein Bca52824_086164 [Brassica carinata]